MAEQTSADGEDVDADADVDEEAATDAVAVVDVDVRECVDADGDAFRFAMQNQQVVVLRHLPLIPEHHLMTLKIYYLAHVEVNQQTDL